MKKIACLSALAAVLAFTAGTSVAATSTVTGGYAQSDAQGQMNKMGGMMGFLDKLPGMSNSGIQDAIAQANPEKQVKKMEAIIQSMTIKERRNPDLMTPSRKKRIAAGCGMDVAEVNKLIKQHAQMAKMMKKFANPSGMAKMMRSLGNMQKQFGGGGMGPLFGNKDQK